MIHKQATKGYKKLVDLRWQLLGIVINFILYLSTLVFYNDGPLINWYTISGDATDYMLYASNLIEEGTFTNGGRYYSRMPMYPSIIAVLFYFFKTKIALTVLVLFQVALAGYASWVAGRLTEIICGSSKAFIYGFYLYALFPLLHAFDIYILTESLATSLFLISFWILVKWQISPGNIHFKHILLLGIVLIFIVGLRPYLSVWFAICTFSLINIEIKTAQGFRRFINRLFLLLLPFLIFESWWITRNHSLSDGNFIPFQQGVYATSGLKQNEINSISAYISVWKWANAVGEDIVYWNPGSFGSWMFRKGPFLTDEFLFSERVFCSTYTVVDINNARQQYLIMDSTSNSFIRDSLAETLTTKFNSYTTQFIKEKPFEYHVLSRLSILKHAFLHSGPVLPLKPWPEIKLFPTQIIYKLWSVFSYWIVLISGMIWAGHVIFTIRSRCFTEGLLAIQALTLFILLGFYFRMTEFRIYQLIFPALTILTAKVLYLSHHFIVNYFNRKSNENN